MTTFAEHQAAPNADADDEAKTGLRGVPTWRGVYGWVMIIFAGLVGVMTAFGIYYS
ncbi:hypothetical protein [Synoicihabitans lomoniglobus]|uniref:Uncharacterized protein n=1 Tax=Synoicihabitans lomoniglobus TaxID=2909285 RepID=A0AAF0CR49_9BACT|nr:hypothetical protein [Opitutaceae bacterium LMO-M01]WED66521.1 hypothetical protein PXH66_06620 [Opitutaceae bacterium LMO-M01]